MLIPKINQALSAMQQAGKVSPKSHGNAGIGTLSNYLGVHQMTVYRWMTGKAKHPQGIYQDALIAKIDKIIEELENAHR